MNDPKAAKRKTTVRATKRKPRRNKFGAHPTNGFASKLESRINDELCAAVTGRHPALAQQLGIEIGDEVRTQWPVKFASGIKHVVDFAIYRGETLVRLVEAKGKALTTWKHNVKLLKHERPELFAIYTVAWGDRYEWVGEGTSRKRRAKKAKA